MQPQVEAPQNIHPRRRLVTIIIVTAVVVIGLALLIGFLAQPKTKNQFGNIIRIQNYDQKVKNLSSDMRDAMESYLYNIVKRNDTSNFDATKVTDAYIRDSSDSQTHNDTNDVYSGNFIVDMASIKQSYQVQYSYSSNPNNVDTGGNPVVISCLPINQLKYGEFNCTDFVTQQSAPNDALLQYLPYQSYDFSITPDATQGKKLVLNVTLTIPDMNLSGDLTSKQATIKTYKQEVTSWIIAKGADPTKYTINYNYDDDGNPINLNPTGGD